MTVFEMVPVLPREIDMVSRRKRTGTRAEIMAAYKDLSRELTAKLNER